MKKNLFKFFQSQIKISQSKLNFSFISKIYEKFIKNFSIVYFYDSL